MKETLRIYGLGLVLIVAGFFVAYQFVEPAPPKTITIATGGKTGGYFAFAQRYRELLSRQGITLEILETAGSIENQALLDSGKADIAFVQSGTGDVAAYPRLRSLGSLYREPLWVFVGDEKVTGLADLAGAAIAVGGEGSGTRAVALPLLQGNGVGPDTATLLPLSGGDAARALLAGEVQALFTVTSAKSQVVTELLQAPGIRLLPFDRADAYSRHFRFLSKVVLPRGAVSLRDDIPGTDTPLMAAFATLAVTEDLHPALASLMMQVIEETHGSGGLFENPGEFPEAIGGDYPLDESAERYYQGGAPFLQRYLPFWAAVLVDRLKVLLVPLLTLMLPLGKILPPVYRWRVRSRIYRWYRDLQAIERRGRAAEPAQRAALLQELDAIEAEVSGLTVPLSYADSLYALRLHIDLVHRKLQTGGNVDLSA